jgi:hypothetical protein
MTYRIKLSIKRRKVFKRTATILKKTFNHDALKNILIINV